MLAWIKHSGALSMTELSRNGLAQKAARLNRILHSKGVTGWFIMAHPEDMTLRKQTT